MNEKQTNVTASKTGTETNREVVSTDLKSVRPTKKQKELLSYIESFISEHGYSPSYREIMHGLRYNSVATVALHVGNLIKRGHIIKRDRSARSLEIVNPARPDPGPNIATDGTDFSGEQWLIKKIAKLCDDVAKSSLPTQKQLDDIAVLLAALNVLGLDEKASNVRERFEELQERRSVV